jgi:flagellar protein FlgJ
MAITSRQDAKSGDSASKKDALEQAAKQFEAILCKC